MRAYVREMIGEKILGIAQNYWKRLGNYGDVVYVSFNKDGSKAYVSKESLTFKTIEREVLWGIGLSAALDMDKVDHSVLDELLKNRDSRGIARATIRFVETKNHETYEHYIGL